MFLMYEDMFENPMLAAQLLAHFLCIDCTDELLTKVVEHSTIEQMKQRDPVGFNHIRQGIYVVYIKFLQIVR